MLNKSGFVPQNFRMTKKKKFKKLCYLHVKLYVPSVVVKYHLKKATKYIKWNKSYCAVPFCRIDLKHSVRYEFIRSELFFNDLTAHGQK